jgi:hypothetical protein
MLRIKSIKAVLILIAIIVAFTLATASFAEDSVYYSIDADDTDVITWDADGRRYGGDWSDWQKCANIYKEQSAIRSVAFKEINNSRLSSAWITCREIIDGAYGSDFESGDLMFNTGHSADKKKIQADLDELAVGIGFYVGDSCARVNEIWFMENKLEYMFNDYGAYIPPVMGDVMGLEDSTCQPHISSGYIKELHCSVGSVLTGFKLRHKDASSVNNGEEITGIKIQCSKLTESYSLPDAVDAPYDGFVEKEDLAPSSTDDSPYGEVELITYGSSSAAHEAKKDAVTNFK